MIDLLVAWAPILILIVVFVVVSRRQSASYRDYLAKHSAETEKMAAQQSATREAVEAQTAALERIAAALEARR
ncbi:MAG: hypothetical protein VX874_01090 [Pseudomonadota bacterium]|nr:hypothetical protein [Pseudomonadota bacterium]